MSSGKTKEWLDLIAAMAVVAGLVLVGYEVRQSNFLAKAQAENSIYEGWETLSMAEIDTGINKIVAKSLSDPESLTDAEVRDIDSWLVAVVALYQRNSRLYYEYGLATDPLVEYDIPFYFNTRVAQNWYRENEQWIRAGTPELADAISRYVESTAPVSTGEADEKTRSSPVN